MNEDPRFFALIIGTEILNRRRSDKHFDFLTDELLRRGYKLAGSFTIEDDPALIVHTLKFLASQPRSVVFSFGGIGSTPDDHTRKAAAIALGDGELVTHPEAREIIQRRIEAMKIPNGRYPLRMAELPRGAKLITENPVNGMPAFYLEDRFFFVPGFPQMSHPMLRWVLDTIFTGEKKPYHRFTLTALCRESELIDVMESLPKDVELSSLPKIYSDGPRVSISVASRDEEAARNSFGRFIDELEKKKIPYSINDER